MPASPKRVALQYSKPKQTQNVFQQLVSNAREPKEDSAAAFKTKSDTTDYIDIYVYVHVYVE